MFSKLRSISSRETQDNITDLEAKKKLTEEQVIQTKTAQDYGASNQIAFNAVIHSQQNII